MRNFLYFLTIFAFNLPKACFSLPTDFPYGQSPQNNVCVSQDNFATPETLLGSWAMVHAVTSDITNHILPEFLSDTNQVVYAVGTAALGNQLGMANCSGGCNALNGFCFALKFNNKAASPHYMIFQSVNIGANDNSVDIYMAGGGAGAFPQFCAKFWGENVANWSDHIENYGNCANYFNYDNVNSSYQTSFQGKIYKAKDILKNACEYASKTGFNQQNFTNISVVPVTCPQSLTQISGVRLKDETSVGNTAIINLKELTENHFLSTNLLINESTQMQDCKTPSSGYCSNVTKAIKNYEASISANAEHALVTTF